MLLNKEPAKRMRSKNAVNNRIAALWQVPAILLVSVVLGVGANYMHSDRLPLMATEKAPPSAVDGLISLGEAKRLFAAGAAVFIDARPAGDYRKGHITGAISLPWEAVDSRFADIGAEIPVDKPIITYCDGANCSLSEHLAKFLREMGFAHVRVLKNGWSLWQRQQLPVESDRPDESKAAA